MVWHAGDKPYKCTHSNQNYLLKHLHRRKTLHWWCALLMLNPEIANQPHSYYSLKIEDIWPEEQDFMCLLFRGFIVNLHKWSDIYEYSELNQLKLIIIGKCVYFKVMLTMLSCLQIVWSRARRRITPRLIRLQTICLCSYVFMSQFLLWSIFTPWKIKSEFWWIIAALNDSASSSKQCVTESSWFLIHLSLNFQRKFWYLMNIFR